jgi:hypothetical protein
MWFNSRKPFNSNDYYFFTAYSDNSCINRVSEFSYPVPVLDMKSGDEYILFNPTDRVYVVANKGLKVSKYSILKVLICAVLLTY